MRKFIIMILAISAASSCQQAEVKKEQSLQAAAENAVMDSLRDPSSANFKNMMVDTKRRIVCGQVNAKNGFGGYAGFDRFIYQDGAVTLLSLDGDEYARKQPRCFDKSNDDIAATKAETKEMIDKLPDGPEKKKLERELNDL